MCNPFLTSTRRFPSFSVILCVVVPALLSYIQPPSARAWDAHGHRVCTLIALDALAGDATMPAWLNEPSWRSRAAYQSAEPDRWRGQRTAQLINENAMDHFIDLEDLEPMGMSLRTLPALRTRYLAQMAVARAKETEKFADYDPAKDPAGDKEYPGFLPHAIMEHFAKLQASFRTLRMLEAVAAEGGRQTQIEQARANVIFHVGTLSHFVADAAQPLHTTRHFNGWVGENPSGYTTSNRFHAYIDGGVVDHHKITYESLKPLAQPRIAGEGALRVTTPDPWTDVLDHIQRSYDQMETLYKMEKDGTLDGAEGKALIEARLVDGSAMLAAMIRAAWQTSEPEGMEIKRFSGWTPAE